MFSKVWTYLAAKMTTAQVTVKLGHQDLSYQPPTCLNLNWWHSDSCYKRSDNKSFVYGCDLLKKKKERKKKKKNFNRKYKKADPNTSCLTFLEILPKMNTKKRMCTQPYCVTEFPFCCLVAWQRLLCCFLLTSCLSFSTCCMNCDTNNVKRDIFLYDCEGLYQGVRRQRWREDETWITPWDKRL